MYFFLILCLLKNFLYDRFLFKLYEKLFSLSQFLIVHLEKNVCLYLYNIVCIYNSTLYGFHTHIKILTIFYKNIYLYKTFLIVIIICKQGVWRRSKRKHFEEMDIRKRCSCLFSHITFKKSIYTYV